ncbi:lasso RiPP family leader peptide-containing protein [Lacihabitans sp. LS3-19]|nr:lasso RiPP family leader peptide-containing protein [Lacihabitans sp. LS3-19]MCP9768733.1 lasso RiPP family leader peptide-containing protein [Lacihabitans sp. LS3-19]
MKKISDSIIPSEKRLKTYQKPKLKKLGSVNKLTLKTGSTSDFGSNRYTI